MSVSLENALLLLARLLLAAIFLHEGFTLISGYTAASAYMARFGVPAILLAPTIAVQLGGGLMLAAGWHTRWGALSLAMFCLATALLFHTGLSIRNELLHFEKDLAIAGGMLVLMVRGPGRWSLDGR